MARVKKIATALWKVFVGAVFCQFLPTAILVVGWSYRAMQRQALRVWRAQSGLSPDELDALWESDPVFRAHVAWPNWLLKQRSLREIAPPATGFGAYAKEALSRVGASLGMNLRIGIAGIANTTAMTLIPVMLWQFGWYAGWDNSFNKGYEQYANGIALSLTGIALFLVAMLYLPMAQARHAVTGEWRAFYDVRTVWRIATGNPVRALVLAGVFSLVALPINVMLVAVQFVDRSPAHQAMSDSEFLQWLNGYYFWVCVVGFLGFVLLRVLAARWYAAGLVAMLHAGRLSADDLKGAEKHALAALGLDRPGERAQRHPIVVATVLVSRPVWKTALLGTAVLLWFSFVAQIYVREFVIYHPYRGFLNQPLVQLPWLRYVPQALQQAAKADRNR